MATRALAFVASKPSVRSVAFSVNDLISDDFDDLELPGERFENSIFTTVQLSEMMNTPEEGLAENPYGVPIDMPNPSAGRNASVQRLCHLKE